ncbi:MULTISPECIES: DUF2004 domain-containing protein [unclassified Clostridium]|uniref:DUF6985 domain-containing protein n=1 Tax=unclassified Clostridium TaxID=2614128 RepID=UPI001897E944|nr:MULTISPECIES: DUF2004 domain-containing protein [unclassified Clostridium]MBP3916082.1 DUF2004 domain-containing protein [Clostridium sp.]MEE0932013.1 DUF2004 domain-containing protein [Clostridium sp.]
MMINDSIFGKIEYDYIWFRRSKIKFFNNEVDIMLMIAGDDEGQFEDGQYEAYQALINKWNEIQETFLEPILEYYKQKRKELGYDIELNKNYPEIKSTKELLNYITLVGIKVPYADIYGGRSIGISFDCSWDEENGLGLRLNNEEVIDVGYQDIAI